MEGIINDFYETQHSLVVEARDMIKPVAIRQGEEKLEQLEKLQNQQTTVLEKMLTTATITTSSVDIFKTVCTEGMRPVLKSDDNNLHAWMRKRGFEVYTDSLMSIGVETIDDLSLVWHEDLTALKIDDETATKISLEIAKLET